MSADMDPKLLRHQIEAQLDDIFSQNVTNPVRLMMLTAFCTGAMAKLSLNLQDERRFELASRLDDVAQEFFKEWKKKEAAHGSN